MASGPTQTDDADQGPPRIDRVAQLLIASYGLPPWRATRSPLDELILTVLSQHTSDVNSGRAFRSLRSRFPTWDDVRTAPTEEVAAAIRSGGLADLKAARIGRILDAILAKQGDLDLCHLATRPLSDAERWLTDLPGVGPKTAACVLLFAFGRPSLPVDTHVHRVARRLGLVAPTTDAADAQRLLAAALGSDRDRVYAFHLNMIAHGRAVCTARRPFCDRCPLTGCCDYFNSYAEPVNCHNVASDCSPPDRR